MTLDDALALSHHINNQDGDYLAAPYNVGSFALVLLQRRDSTNGPSGSPIVEVDRYLALMEQHSSAVESDQGLQEALRQWRALRQAQKQAQMA